jgi:Spy/CpxP family protein refolding chaperone
MSQISQMHTLRRAFAARQVVVVIFHLIALTMFGLIPVASDAARLPHFSIDTPAHASPSMGAGSEALQRLNALQDKQDQIRQRASTATSDAQLFELDALSRSVAEDVDRLITTSLEPDRAKTHAQLDVLGAAPVSESAAETPAVAQQRSVLAAEQSQLDAEIRQAATIKENLANLSAQITRLLHNHLKDQLALRSDSIVSAGSGRPRSIPTRLTINVCETSMRRSRGRFNRHGKRGSGLQPRCLCCSPWPSQRLARGFLTEHQNGFAFTASRKAGYGAARWRSRPCSRPWRPLYVPSICSTSL